MIDFGKLMAYNYNATGYLVLLSGGAQLIDYNYIWHISQDTVNYSILI